MDELYLYDTFVPTVLFSIFTLFSSSSSVSSSYFTRGLVPHLGKSARVPHFFIAILN